MTDAQASNIRVEFSQIECRVVGSLIEKAFLTPDVYPMTTNGLIAACNQKTNRQPVTSYDAVAIDASLLDLRQRKVVRMVHTQGARATKHRHTLDELLDLDEAALAVVSVLLLRGPQTVGELRLRTERQHGFYDLESTENCLESLAERAIPLVRQLVRQPGQKEERWQHLLAEAEADATTAAEPSTAVADPAVQERPVVSQPRAHVSPAPSEPETAAPTAPSPGSGRLSERVEALEADVARLNERLSRLASQLGETFD